jgi:hypothetical protein
VFGVGTRDFPYLIAANAAILTMADDASPESFHDANENIVVSPTPHATPSSAAHQGTTYSVSSTPSPLQQRQLFPTNPSGGDDTTPRYLCRPTTSNIQVSLNMSDVAEEQAEHGDGDSIAEAIESAELEEALEESLRDRLLVLVKNEGSEEEVLDCERNSILLKKGLAAEISMPSAPSDWTPPIPKAEKGEPMFVNVDNPGEWPQFTYRPKFQKTGTKEYAHHSLPTGARPVPSNPEGKRVVNGWEFHYEKWNSPDQASDSPNFKSRSGATSTNPFPDNRKGRLDYELLKKMKLTKRRIVEGDALFFLQLLLPIGDPKKSGIEDDPRLPYYSEVERWTQKYATSIGLGGSYGHSFKEAMVEELLRFDSVVIRDGVHGGTDGAIYRRWRQGETTFDKEIAKSISHTRWLQLKRTYKLCDNQAAPKKGDKGYNPGYKFDYIFKCIINNINELSHSSDLDLCGDETTWAHNGFGEAGTGLLARVMGKPGVTKGGQIVLLSDAYRNRPRAYLHRHKCHPPIAGFTRQGPMEVRMVMEDLKHLVEGEEADGRRQIFTEKPHSTWDNFFSGDDINDWIGQNGFGVTMTCRRDRLPRGVPNHFFHKVATAPGDTKARVARFNNPITVVKHVVVTPPPPAGATGGEPEAENEQPGTPPLKFTRVHVTFQSTSSCNITTVNALNQNSLFVVPKERGSGKQKRKWVIEMNDARQLYLATYGRIDTIDNLIKKCQIYYCCWKYWHSAKNHGLSLAVVVAYGMYKECASEPLARAAFGFEPDDEPFQLLSFHDFRDKLSGQGLAYSPLQRRYPGDSAMRAVTRLSMTQQKRMFKNKNEERRKPGRPKKKDDEEQDKTNAHVVKPGQLKIAKRFKVKSRLCGDLTAINHHIKEREQMKHDQVCSYCGEPAYTRCTVCPEKPALHFYPSKGPNMGKSCFLDYHNDCCFGLARRDFPVLLGKRKSEWTPPSEKKKKANAKYIRNLVAEEAEATESEATH